MDPSPSDDIGALERARERLYSPGGTPNNPRPLENRPPSIFPHGWMARVAPGAHHHVRLALVFFIGAGAFFLFAGAIAAFFFLTGANSVSTTNIAITIQGPTTIAGGDTVPLALVVTNHNPTPIKNAILEVDFPPGTRSSANVLNDYPRYQENIGTLSPGASISRSVSAVLFGSAGDQISLPVSLSFSTGGSNATFVKQSTYALSITSAPLSLSLAALSQAVSGQPFSLLVTVRNNATTPINNVVLAAQYPSGFTFGTASMPNIGTNFLLGTLAPGATQTVKINGVLSGTANDQKAFHFSIGTAASAGSPAATITYMTQETNVTLTPPFLAVLLSLNGDQSDSPVLAPGTEVVANISYTNTLTAPVNNASIAVAVAGSGIDLSSIVATRGFYDSAHQTVDFNNTTDPSLASLAPGATGIGSFSFKTTSGGRNPTISFTISVNGTRLDESNVPQSVNASATKTALVQAAPTFSVGISHTSAIFPNSGPIPPVANQTTTYTVSWSVVNTGNDLAGGTVTATLPSYVTYKNLTQPANGSITYDDPSRTVTWNVGDLSAGASTKAAFQISFTPSTSQRGTAPQLVSSATFTAHDRFAGTTITSTSNPLTTETPGDPGYTASKADVQ